VRTVEGLRPGQLRLKKRLISEQFEDVHLYLSASTVHTRYSILIAVGIATSLISNSVAFRPGAEWAVTMGS
jgi:hypothetical protein